ncbi:MAG: hypothetical protein KO206_01590 [Methanomicrobiaceae archaeon]|uniref:Transposase zinc-ribbon domain-containing protein n=1 Tax=hydrocarbon metagenome TaxID=938273 RepID=A0A0W8FH01_9ZZZZ|nr:hypothetical protein [Methanomicrobiaceae archaeon]
MLHCPVCNSTEVYAVVGGYAGFIYRCKTCGYRGSFIVEYDTEEEERKRS